MEPNRPDIQPDIQSAIQSKALLEKQTQLPQQGRRAQQRRRLLLTGASFVLLVLGIAWYIGAFGGNVRTVSPGRVYRSAQLAGNGIGPLTACWTGHSLEQVIATDHIATVLNLRGGTTQNDWYRQERRICEQRGVTHIDISMSAIREPNPVQLRRLLTVFDRARYPILYHCQGGSDRSGLVGTLYLNIYQGVALDEAEQRQLTMRYAHFKFTRTGAMDRFFDLYRRTSRGLGLRQWITDVYPALFAELPDSAKSAPPEAQELQTNPF